jgi:hypothetical protein
MQGLLYSMYVLQEPVVKCMQVVVEGFLVVW